MATYAGKEGSVTFATTAIGELTGWTLNAEVEMLDDTVMGDDWKTVKGGLGSWSGTATGYLDYGNAQQAAAIVDIMVASPTGDSVALVFLAATGKTFLGSALVSNVSIDASKDNIIGVGFTFTGNGQLTVSWA